MLCDSKIKFGDGTWEEGLIVGGVPRDIAGKLNESGTVG